VPAARFASNNLVVPDTLARLRAQSEVRVRGSEDFAELQKDIDRFQQFKKEKTVPLREDKFLARRKAEGDAEKKEEKHIEEQNTGKKEVFKDDYYNREVVQITLDYLNELTRPNVARVN